MVVRGIALEDVAVPERIPVPKENEEILACIQKLSLGVSKDWVFCYFNERCHGC